MRFYRYIALSHNARHNWASHYSTYFDPRVARTPCSACTTHPVWVQFCLITSRVGEGLHFSSSTVFVLIVTSHLNFPCKSCHTTVVEFVRCACCSIPCPGSGPVHMVGTLTQGMCVIMVSSPSGRSLNCTLVVSFDVSILIPYSRFLSPHPLTQH